MLTKNGGYAWNSKVKPTGDNRRCALGSWPQLRKNEGVAKDNEVETWPKLGGPLGRKNAGNQQLESVHQIHSSHNNNISLCSLAKPQVNPGERQESFSKSLSNEFENSSTNTKRIDVVRTSDSIESSQNPLYGNSEKVTLSSREEKILAFKQLQKERKEEVRKQRRRKKEDDALKKLLGPKGLKVTVIDSNVFSKFCDQGDNRIRSRQAFYDVSGVQRDSAFPELRRSSEKSFVKDNVSLPKRTLNLVPVEGNERTSLIAEEFSEKTLDASTTKSTKPRKRRDPVVVDILKAIEICQAGKKLDEELELDDFVRVSRQKDTDKSRFAGNILDASNPARHRGKKREIPRKRNETRLKKAIIAERRRRHEARNCGSKRASVGNLFAHQIEIFNAPGATFVLMPDVNTLCSPVEVLQESKLLGNAVEQKYVEGGEQHEKCLLKPCSDTSNTIDVDKMTKDSLHSRNFREYCNHSKSADLSENVKLVLKDILKFQDRMHATQPIKAESHRRYVVGLRQTQHLLAVNKVKIVVMAQDLEKVPSPGGLDDIVNSIIDSANKQSVPVVFPLTRRQMGKVTYRKVGVSCVGVLNYQGSEENFKNVISALEGSKKDYKEKYEREKLRIMSDLGILPIKEENSEDAVSQEQVQLSRDECAVTLPLLQKLTEAISELSVGSTSQIAVKEELSEL